MRINLTCSRLWAWLYALSLAFLSFQEGRSDSSPALLYQNDFEKAEVGQVPSDMMLLDGAFAIKEEAGNRFLELPGAPVDSYGILFGPSRTNHLAVSARIRSTNNGRRFPVFSVAVIGAAGFKLRASPAKRALEILRGDLVVSSVPFEWKPGSWLRLKLQITQAPSQVAGKAWVDGTSEPREWMIIHQYQDPPPAGRPSIWGSPISGMPIAYDDLAVAAIGEP